MDDVGEQHQEFEDSVDIGRVGMALQQVVQLQEDMSLGINTCWWKWQIEGKGMH